MNSILGLLAIAIGFAIVQKIFYKLLVDGKREQKLLEERIILSKFGEEKLFENNTLKLLVVQSVPATLSSLPILFSFGFIGRTFSETLLRLPFKIPAIVRGFPPIGMRDYFGWIYLFTVFFIASAIILTKLTFYLEMGRNSEDLKSNTGGG